MNDNEYLAGIICEHLESGSPVVMVSIVSLRGSSPRHAGTKMVISAKGSFGTVGGSLLEAKAIEMSRMVLDQKESRLLNYDLNGENAYSKGMICGGKATVLLDFITPAEDNKIFFQNWKEAVKNGSDFYFLTQISETETDEKVKIIGRGLLSLEGQLLGKSNISSNDLDSLKPELHTISSTAIFALKNGQLLVDFIRRLKTLCCFGAGHVALPTAHIASLAGFSVVVIDDRAEFANLERFPDAEVQVTKDYHQAMEGLKIDEDSFIVIVTRGHQYDRTVLEQALQTHAGYIGMISSRRKREAIYNALTENGVTRQALEQVHSPIGLDIGAETPEEIAVSIVAELIRERANQQAKK
jgi:xanthine dehydrogenase accessory factor